MGGYGSGRREKRTTVEECLTLDSNCLKWMRPGLPRDNPLHLPPCFRQTLSCRISGGQRASLGYSFEETAEGLMLRLRYLAARQQVDLPIRLHVTQPHFGGKRWWFNCPISSDGCDCGRRVAKLHLPPGCSRFGCRFCHNLTYRSCQEAHKVDFFSQMIAA